MITPFFVYGTLKRSSRFGRSTHNHRLLGTILEMYPAKVMRYTLKLGRGFPFAVPSMDDHILGELYYVADYKRTLHTLDWLEGYTPGSEYNLYDRIMVRALYDGGSAYAWMYVASDPVVTLPVLGEEW